MSSECRELPGVQKEEGVEEGGVEERRIGGVGGPDRTKPELRNTLGRHYCCRCRSLTPRGRRPIKRLGYLEPLPPPSPPSPGADCRWTRKYSEGRSSSLFMGLSPEREKFPHALR